MPVPAAARRYSTLVLSDRVKPAVGVEMKMSFESLRDRGQIAGIEQLSHLKTRKTFDITKAGENAGSQAIMGKHDPELLRRTLKV